MRGQIDRAHRLREELLRVDFLRLAVDLLRLAVDFLRLPLLFFRLERFGLAGTLAPFWRASDRPIAIACLRLVTFLPLRPLRSVPFLRLRIADSTVFLLRLPYFAMAGAPRE
jgi:hypothetical protein